MSGGRSARPPRLAERMLALALAAGGVGAFLPGALDVEFKGLVQAGGALALFTLVYLRNPASGIS